MPSSKNFGFDVPIDRARVILTFKNLPGLIDLVPHLIHVVFTEVSMRGMTDLYTTSTRQKVIRSTQSISI
jgi:hypothetical protein